MNTDLPAVQFIAGQSVTYDVVVDDAHYTCRFTPMTSEPGNIIRVDNIKRQRRLDERVVTASQLIDKALIGVAITSIAVLQILTEIYKDDPSSLRIISAVSAGMNILIALCPVKSNILDRLKK